MLRNAARASAAPASSARREPHISHERGCVAVAEKYPHAAHFHVAGAALRCVARVAATAATAAPSSGRGASQSSQNRGKATTLLLNPHAPQCHIDASAAPPPGRAETRARAAKGAGA